MRIAGKPAAGISGGRSAGRAARSEAGFSFDLDIFDLVRT
jgi:hypothetical protein